MSRRLFSFCLFFTLSTSLFGQIKIDVSEAFLNSGEIYQGDEIIGSFVYSYIEGVSDSVNRYEVTLYDETYTEMAEIDFVHSPITLEKVIVNNGQFVLFFESLNEWVIGTLGADKEIKKEIVLKSDLDKRKLNTIRLSYYMGEYQGDNSYDVLGDSTFLVMTNDWGFKEGDKDYSQVFRLTAYGGDLKKKWSFSDTNDKRTVAKIVGRSDKYIAIVSTIFEGFRQKDGNIRSKFYIIDLANGRVISRELLMGFDSKNFLMTKACFHEDNKKVSLFGKYYEKSEAILENPSEGLVILNYTIETNERTETLYLWDDLIDNLADKDVYGMSKAPSKFGRVKFLQSAFLFDDTNVGLFFESFSDRSAMTQPITFYLNIDQQSKTTKCYVMKGVSATSSNLMIYADYAKMGHFFAEEATRYSPFGIRFIRENDETGEVKVICHIPAASAKVGLATINSNKERVKEDEITVLTLNKNAFQLDKIAVLMNYDYIEIREGAGDLVAIFDYNMSFNLSSVTRKLMEIRLEQLKF